jgi:hypothetical protein
MKNIIIITRHGSRGVRCSKLSSEVPLFNSDKYLSYNGIEQSEKLGKWIKKHYGRIEYSCGNYKKERNIATTIAVSKGNGLKYCYTNINEDIYHKKSDFLNDDDLKISNDILENYKNNFETYRNMIQKINDKQVSLVREALPPKPLSDTTSINKNGKISGYLNEIMSYIHLGYFSILNKNYEYYKYLGGRASRTSETCLSLTPLYKKSFNLKFPTMDLKLRKAQKIYNFYMSICSKNKLSYVSSNEKYIHSMSYLFGKEFYKDGYVPPCSGYIITLYDDIMKVELIILKLNGKYKKYEYYNGDIIPFKSIEIDYQRRKI